MKCNDKVVTDLVSEIAIDIFHEESDQDFVLETCNQLNVGLLFWQGVNCSDLFGTFFSSVFYADQANVLAVRTTSTSDSGIQYCAADIEYIIGDRDIENLIKNYFNNSSISQELRDSYINNFIAVYQDLFNPFSSKVSGNYNVQLTDDRETFYVNLEVDIDNVTEVPLN